MREQEGAIESAFWVCIDFTGPDFLRLVALSGIEASFGNSFGIILYV